MFDHLQLCRQSQDTTESMQRFGGRIGYVSFPGTWHFPSLEVKGCFLPGWLSSTLQAELCWGSAQCWDFCHRNFTLHLKSRQKNPCKESWWGLQLAGMDAGRIRWDERGEARSRALPVHIICRDQTH